MGNKNRERLQIGRQNNKWKYHARFVESSWV